METSKWFSKFTKPNPPEPVKYLDFIDKCRWSPALSVFAYVGTQSVP